VDGEFVYASTSPYEVRWDTSTVADGSHIIRADAYDNSGNYAGSSSIKVLVENTIPTPEGGVLLTVKFGEHDIFNRIVTGRGEMSALRADQVLPQGFDVLAGELRGELNQTVLDAYYEGVTALVRNRLRTASLTAEALRQSVPEVGQYTMVQVSRNGLTIPASSATSRPRLGLGEVSLAFADYPVLPGDTWESPLGAVYDLYTRRAIFVQARHTFEGLRWFRGRECAVVSSSYTLPELPLLEKAPAAQPQTTAAAAIGDGFQVALTGGRRGGGGMRGGGGARGGGMRAGGGMRGGAGGRGGTRGGAARAGATARGGGARRGAARGRTGQAAPGGAGRITPQALESARLVTLEGERITYVTRESGRIVHTEDTIRGKVEFRAGASQRASLGPDGGYAMALTGGRRGGGGGGRGGGGRGGMRGGARGGAARGGAGTRGGAARGGAARGRTAQRGGAARGAGRAPGEQGPRQIPPSLDYGFRLTTELALR
jgi:hypothetical protein